MQVAVRPQLPPLTVDAFPDRLLSSVNLSSILPKDDWDKLSQETCRAARFRWACISSHLYISEWFWKRLARVLEFREQVLSLSAGCPSQHHYFPVQPFQLESHGICAGVQYQQDRVRTGSRR